MTAPSQLVSVCASRLVISRLNSRAITRVADAMVVYGPRISPFSPKREVRPKYQPSRRHSTVYSESVYTRLAWESISVLLRQHDREHSRGDLGISRIFGAELAGLIVIVDLPKERPTVDFESTEIPLSMRIVVRGEVRKGLNGH